MFKQGISLKRLKLNTFFILLVMMGCSRSAHSQDVALPADKKATAETKMLYQNMFKLMEQGVMYGHQEDLAYGVGWQGDVDRSDVKSITGQYPAVYGWDMGRIELDSAKNLDGVPFADMVGYIKQVYNRGGINTISWHMDDPITAKNALGSHPTSVKLILDSDKYQFAYELYLDKFADFASKLKGADGKLIPIIFRPYHECTGNWFWWGTTSCTPAEYIGIWRFTYNYLTKLKQLHNLIFAYSTSDFTSEDNYLERYPGDDYVDVMGFDAYCDTANKSIYKQYITDHLQILNRIAHKHAKIPALTEFGYNTIPDANWWTQSILPVISAYRVSYMLTWRNWKEDHFFTPYPGQTSATDFKLFFDDPVTLFQNDLRPDMYKRLIK